MSLDQVLARLHADEQTALDRLADWLRIPSVSTDPAHAADCRKAAEWASDFLADAGFDASILPTGTDAKPGHPVVLAHAPGEPGYAGPHILFYGHYDVQPADPLELWDSPPFEPTFKPATPNGPGERVVARGAVDDKGQVMTFLEAMRVWHATTGKPAGGLRITVMLEGEEESGSVNLERFIDNHKQSLSACDVCLISDTGMLGRGKPAITYGIRGLAYTEATLTGPNQDLHSGAWGGRVLNPATELCRIIAHLHDDKRRVTIPGFYDDVIELTDDERAAWRALPLDPAGALDAIGLPPEADVGEAGYSAYEREWARPTAEVNGIFGGYTGHGAKTIIPSKATAKVSFRLVANQDPGVITRAYFEWLRERTPAGFSWTLTDHGGGFPATVPTESPTLSAACRALERAADVAPAMIKTGGSIPVAGLLKQKLGLDTIFMGFGLDDDRVHSPNEKFELACYRMGARAHAILVEELHRMGS
jgi:acetylornithine deacetylase/succinyl-diaminopimelate desuccinylase-like protein